MISFVNMNKSDELILITTGNGHGVRNKIQMVPKLSNVRLEVDTSESSKKNESSKEKRESSKFTMIFNKCSTKLNLRPSKNQDISKDKNGSKYTMIFNKDVTFRPKANLLQPILSKTDLKADKNTKSVNASINPTKTLEILDTPFETIEPVLNPDKLSNEETIMAHYGRSNFFKPELTMCDTLAENEEISKSKRNLNQTNVGMNEISGKANDRRLRIHSSLTSLSKNKFNRRSDNMLKNKIASLTSLEAHLARETSKKHVLVNQERKVFRVRSLDLSESVSSSDNELEKSLNFQKSNTSPDDSQVIRTGLDSNVEIARESDKKSKGDALRKEDKENGCRKQVQWKSEVDVIYFESHQAAEGDRFGEILGRVMEPLREEWEQQRTGFYAKMVPLPIASHLSERWQSLLKI